MNYADIKPNDSINGEGISVSLFVSGCTNCCKGCFNKETWDFNYGKEFTEKEMNYILDCINKNGVMRNFSLLGGDPMHKKNLPTCIQILKKVKEVYPNITTYVWTGYLYEDLLEEYGEEIFKDINVLIDGKFEIDKFSKKLNYRGSSNQRIIKVQESLNSGKTVLHELNNTVN